MSKSTLTVEGDSVSSLLLRCTQSNSDTMEEAFYKLNPDMINHGPVLKGGVTVLIPSIEQSQAYVVKKRRSVWD